MVRDEATFVEEWARHYMAEGVEHFYVIDQENAAGGGRGPLRLGRTAAALEVCAPLWSRAPRARAVCASTYSRGPARRVASGPCSSGVVYA